MVSGSSNNSRAATDRTATNKTAEACKAATKGPGSVWGAPEQGNVQCAGSRYVTTCQSCPTLSSVVNLPQQVTLKQGTCLWKAQLSVVCTPPSRLRPFYKHADFSTGSFGFLGAGISRHSLAACCRRLDSRGQSDSQWTSHKTSRPCGARERQGRVPAAALYRAAAAHVLRCYCPPV